MKKMKNIIKAIIVILFVFPIFNSCKKGADDPCFSLKSRDSRITAKWKLTSIMGDWLVINYNGTNYSSGMNNGIGTYEMEILKDGTLTYNESYAPAGSSVSTTTTGTANWWWSESDKNKTYIIISGGGDMLFSSGRYYVDELKGKELILKPLLTYSPKYIFEKE